MIDMANKNECHTFDKTMNTNQMFPVEAKINKARNASFDRHAPPNEIAHQTAYR